MKKIRQHTIVGTIWWLVSAALLYAGNALYAWSFNPSGWDPAARLWVGIILFIYSVIMGFVIIDKIKD